MSLFLMYSIPGCKKSKAVNTVNGSWTGTVLTGQQQTGSVSLPYIYEVKTFKL